MTGSIAPFTFRVRVYYEDTDAAGVVYYANYLKFIERARTEWLRAAGVELDDVARDDGVVFMVRSVSADWHRPARLGDLLEVTTRLVDPRRASFVLEQDVVRDGDTLFAARVRLACVDVAGGNPRPVPARILSIVSPWKTP